MIVELEAAVGKLIAQSIRDLIEASPTAALGLATASTPLPIYRGLARSLAEDPLDLSGVRGFSLDE